jgi:hypothetical protein
MVASPSRILSLTDFLARFPALLAAAVVRLAVLMKGRR